MNKIITFTAEQEAASNQPFLRFADLTALDQVELNFEFVFHASLYRRLTYAGQPLTKAAFLVTSSEAEHYAKLHAMLTDYSPLDVAVFKDRGAAAKWLGVPPELLEMPQYEHGKESAYRSNSGAQKVHSNSQLLTSAPSHKSRDSQ